METDTLPSHRRPAPGELELVRSLVNTWDLEDGTDELDSPDRLRAWLAERRLLGRGARVTPAGVERVQRLREALRKLLLANNGETLDPGAVRDVNALSERAPLALRFAPDGSAALEAVPGDVDGAVARLLGVVARSMAEGTWGRLKACPWGTCQWAFYDNSKNASRTWCDMAVCGNRAKARAYRERHRRTAGRRR